jgi:hypothetical protein
VHDFGDDTFHVAVSFGIISALKRHASLAASSDGLKDGAVAFTLRADY